MATQAVGSVGGRRPRLPQLKDQQVRAHSLVVLPSKRAVYCTVALIGIIDILLG